MFVIWCCIRSEGEFSRELNWSKPRSSFLLTVFKALRLSQLLFVCVSVSSHVPLVLSFYYIQSNEI